MNKEKKLLCLTTKVDLPDASVAGLLQVVYYFYKSIKIKGYDSITIHSFKGDYVDGASIFEFVLGDFSSDKRATVTFRDIDIPKDNKEKAVKKVVESVSPDVIVAQCGMLGYTSTNNGRFRSPDKSHLLLGLSTMDLTNVDCSIFGALNESEKAFERTPLNSKASKFTPRCYLTTTVVGEILHHINDFFGTSVKIVPVSNAEYAEFIESPLVKEIDNVQDVISSTKPREKAKRSDGLN